MAYFSCPQPVTTQAAVAVGLHQQSCQAEVDVAEGPSRICFQFIGHSITRLFPLVYGEYGVHRGGMQDEERVMVGP